MTPQPPSPSVAILGTRGYPSYYGGFETAVRKLAPYLADSGWDVTVYGRRGSTHDEDADLDERVKTVVTRGTDSKSLSTLTYGFWSALDALRHKPDVALVMNVANGFWLPLLRLRGIPVVMNVDGIEWDREKWGRLAKLVFRVGAWFSARFASEIIVDAVAIGDRWEAELGRRGSYLPYGGDTPPDLPVPDGLEHRGYVLLVARFVPENSIAEFFAAVPELAQRAPVVLVGSTGHGGHFDNAARELADQHDNVFWLGHVDDDDLLLALWQHAGVYFHGHSVGGTNPALVQAMACGAPIVARDTVYSREVLEGTGVLVAVDGIVGAVTRLLSDTERAEELSRSARVRAATAYSWTDVCGRYEEMLAARVRRAAS